MYVPGDAVIWAVGSEGRCKSDVMVQIVIWVFEAIVLEIIANDRLWWMDEPIDSEVGSI